MATDVDAPSQMEQSVDMGNGLSPLGLSERQLKVEAGLRFDGSGC